MTNRLAGENSPYLLQHAENPVDWFPWGPEALELAQSQQKPIFLSIGYSACHWCHVMEHESFEDPQIARLLNENFISIKVDREERPDLDQLYMEAVQMMTGRGGWPMSVFLTPGREPFFGGTYWPPVARGGMPGFREVLRAVAEAWRGKRRELIQQGRQIADVLGQELAVEAAAPGALGAGPLEAAEAALLGTWDRRYGGFGSAPKFPPTGSLRVLLRRWRRRAAPGPLEPVRLTLDRMAAGGMYDQLGGGFHRYSVDDRWLVPHFEKMLYDNALLAACYLEGWQATGDPDYARVVRETLDYVLRDMTDPEGGFHSAEDADSEGEEGVFYLWTPAEITAVLGAGRAERFCYFFDVTEAGNFEGRNILHRPKGLDSAARILHGEPEPLRTELAESRQRLLDVRSRRVRPRRDDKILVSWNGLMIDALARAGAALAEPRYLDAAARAADFLWSKVRDAEGRLLHYARQGRAGGVAYLDDYASLAQALVTLYETRYEERWIEAAQGLADQVLDRFADQERGGFYYSQPQADLLARKKDLFDSPMPSGTGLATMVLLRLGKLSGRDDYLRAAERALSAAMPLMQRAPAGTGQMLLALDMYLGPTPQIVVLGGEDHASTSAVLAALHGRFLPNKVLAYGDRATPPEQHGPLLAEIFRGKAPRPPGPTVFICEDFACQAPASGLDASLAAVDALARGESGKGTET
jgi:uncharacterized protein YyaL (SSP411 family)